MVLEKKVKKEKKEHEKKTPLLENTQKIENWKSFLTN